MKYILLYLILFFSLSVDGFSNDYLKQEHNISAERFTKSPYATDFQVLSQVLESSKTVGVTLNTTFEQNATEYVISYEHNNTESLSRKITIAALYGKNSNALVQILLNSQNLDGGFGELPGFVSTVVDTTFALKALSNTAMSSDSIANAVTFLMTQQNSDGGWGEGVNESNVYLSAMSMHALWLTRNQYDVTSSLEAAKTYLESQRNSDGLWSEHFQSAVALIAITPMLSDNSSLLVSVDALNQAQLANQSWDNDPYTTALVLQAIAMASKPILDPDLDSVHGIVMNSDNIPLKDVNVVLQGTDQNLSTLSSDNGQFTFSSLKNGTYKLSFTLENFTKMYTNITVDNNDIVINDVIMYEISLGSTSATIKGIVKDSTSILPLDGVTVTINGTQFTTDASGYYVAEGLPLEIISIQFEKDGYMTNNTALDLSEAAIYVYSPLLLKKSDAKTVLKGIVLGEDNRPVSAAKVILSGANEAVVLTDSKGSYYFTPLKPGLTTVTVSHDDFTTVMTTIDVELNRTYSYSPIIYIGGSFSLKGEVVDKETLLPIIGADVLLEPFHITTLTTSDGSFTFEDLVWTNNVNMELAIQASGYSESRIRFSSVGANLNDLGQIQLVAENNETGIEIFGYVTDINGTALPDTIVSIVETAITAVTDLNGYYSLKGIEQDSVIQTVLRDGYAFYQEALQLNDVKSLQNDIVLNPFIETGIIIESLTSDKKVYQAFEQVEWMAKISNQSDLARHINVVVDILDPLGSIIDHSEEFQQITGGSQEGIYILPGSIQELRKSWNTANYMPGTYAIQVTVKDVYTNTLYAQQDLFIDIAPAQRLESIYLTATPTVTVQQDSSEIIIQAELENFSNIAVSSKISIEILDPIQQVIHSSEKLIELASGVTSTKIELEPIILDLSTSGNYSIRATCISDICPNEITASTIKVLPNIHIKVNQNIEPSMIEPHMDQKATIKIQLKGVAQ